MSTVGAALLHRPGLCPSANYKSLIKHAVAVQNCIAMHKVPMDRSFPVDKGSKEATFTALAANFMFNDKVRDLFLDGSMENLDDFRYYFADEEEIDAFVAMANGWAAPDHKHQTTVVKQAWTAVRQSGLRQSIYSTASPTTKASMILEMALEKARVQFWKRYKLKYPVEVLPSDYPLSRCYTEIGMRLLTVYDIWELKVSPHQVSTAESKQAISPIKSGSKADVKPKNPGVEDYLSALHTYLLALAVVGSAEMQGAPAEEAFDTDTTKFVEIPWDVFQAYYFRARRSVMLVPEASRLAWLEERDTWERTVWASQFRETHRSLGQVVQSVMGGMKDHWDTQSQGMAGRANPASRPSLYQRKPGREGTYGLGCVRTRGSHHHPPRQLSRPSREGVMSVK
jgi:hypothetical protein